MDDHRKSRLIGLGLIVLAAVSLITTVVVLVDYRQVTSCQAEYNKNYNRALTERAEAANRDRAATKSLAQGTVSMLDTVLNPSANTDQRRGAVEQYKKVNQDYVKLTEEAETKRNLNPLPITPECALQ